MRNPFKSNIVSLNRVHHTVYVVENGERLKLVVNADPMRITAGLSKARDKLTALINKEEPTQEEMLDAAEFYAAVLFGKEQTEQLKEFYAGDAACMINICGQIFREQLAKKITEAQKRMG